MLRGVFHTKEGRIITAVVVCAVIIISLFAFTSYSQNKRFVEQAVMAENYLKAGSYEQAIEAYLKALSMKNNDEQTLTTGLADAYAGLKEYDKALEVLRSCYQKTSGIKIKEKIEEVTAAKTDYEYLQTISRAEVYFSNSEYEKAIAEFEKAKQIKSKEAASYQRIAEAYIEMGEYDLAREEALEGQEITKDKSMDDMLAQVDSYIEKEQYDALLTQAAEYILLENYEDGIAQYEKAIDLIPEESAAYCELAKIYISQAEYDKAVQLLEGAKDTAQSDELKDLLSQAKEKYNLEEEKRNVLNSLYNALAVENVTAITTIMDLALFKEGIASEAPLYYDSGKSSASDQTGMIIYDSKTVYYGDIQDGKRKGFGIFFIRTEGRLEPGYYYYEGEWDKDMPNGKGKAVEESYLPDEAGQRYSARTVTEGQYNNALEEGKMTKCFYIKNKETGRLVYTAKAGVPMPFMDEENGPSPAPAVGNYVIGKIYENGEPTDQYYSVESQTIWGVMSFIKNE